MTAKRAITLVLYKPGLDDSPEIVASLGVGAQEYDVLYVLISGSREEYSSMKQILLDNLLDPQKLKAVHRFDNLGFAAGHNMLIDWAFADGAGTVLVVNPDVVFDAGALTRLWIAVDVEGSGLFAPVLKQVNPGAAVASNLIDSNGIRWSASGRHFDQQQGDPWSARTRGNRIVAGVTGACLIVPRGSYSKLLSDGGQVFDGAFLAYREDAELGVRAAMIGIPSIVLDLDGFGHVRSVRGSNRGKVLPDLLGVRNRFLLRWRLGRHRPGVTVLSLLRDLLVVIVTATVERRSLPGLKQAFAIRRFITVTSSTRGE